MLLYIYSACTYVLLCLSNFNLVYENEYLTLKLVKYEPNIVFFTKKRRSIWLDRFRSMTEFSVPKTFRWNKTQVASGCDKRSNQAVTKQWAISTPLERVNFVVNKLGNKYHYICLLL